jgi:hypothetical protein
MQRTYWWSWSWVSRNSADEAGQYLTAYKQSEHRQPTLIRERVDKTPSALLRTALTSIPRVNKTDVETLRASFGVRPLFPLSSSPVYIYIAHTELCEDSTGGRDAARATPRFRPEKGGEAQRCFRTAVPHRYYDQRARGSVHISTCSRTLRLYEDATAHADHL